ncbi:MAG: Arylsulfotransferase (ASST) [candidate division BRC1 bacterium ADurb.BinA364]|nr:MAG: Arylsulfotransferase (ASST) [candidate division BRC1 bacterium ADurb.BinA364]
MPVSVFPKGVTIYDPAKCRNGYTLLLGPPDGGPTVVLTDMNGGIVHRWKMSGGDARGKVDRARLLAGGRLLVLRTMRNRIDGWAEMYSWDGELEWDYAPPGELFPHHDIETTADGNVLLICRESVPEAIRRQAREPQRRERLYSDVIQEISPDKRVVWEWRQYEHLDIHRCVAVPAPPDWWAGPENNTLIDWTHTNTIQALPENRWFDSGDRRFRPGNLLMSLRQLDLLLIVDRDTKRIVWEYTGDFRGGLSGQHDSHMIEKGLPGEGNILIFDNGASPTKNLWHCGASYILEIEPPTGTVVWAYDKQEQFHSNFTSSCQRLDNGNTLILESAHGRLFETTPDCHTVWEHVFAWAPRTQRAYRYPYDFCPQTQALPAPEERPVAPAY